MCRRGLLNVCWIACSVSVPNYSVLSSHSSGVLDILRPEMFIEMPTLRLNQLTFEYLYFRSTGDITSRTGKEANLYFISTSVMTFDVALALWEVLSLDNTKG